MTRAYSKGEKINEYAFSQTTRLIMRNASRAAGLLGFAGGATYASNNVKEVMPDFLIEKKAEEIAKNQEYAKSLVQLAFIESMYNTARGILHVTLYTILTWSIRKLVQDMIRHDNSKDRNP